MSRVSVGFLAAPGGRLSTSVFLPEDENSPVHWVIHVPAFAEEMNKSRAMISLQARSLADTGIAVIVPDLFGTGDSEGEFSAADWNQWKSDLKFLIQWVRDQGSHRITLWGLRLGCLLALDLVQQDSESIAEVLMWQPVLSGKLHMGQFLRLRMASSLMRGDTETVTQIRDHLLAGHYIEVAGYQLSPAMFQQMEAVSAANMRIPSGMNIRILEVVSSAEKPLLPVTLKQVDLWQESGAKSFGSSHQGDPFWMTQEIAYARALIEVTSGYLTGAGGVDEPLSRGRSIPELFPTFGDDAHESEAVIFPCAGEELVGVLHRPSTNAGARCGVLIVVGGPQYRIGSHRQFVYLARALADQGIPVFRFDYRGMGDSSGSLSGYTDIHTDIAGAIDAFQRAIPGLMEVVMWGLCDAATASVFYASGDERVKGLVLVNPWVYSPQGAAKAYLKHYYLDRLLSKGFWRKVLKGEYNPFSSASSLIGVAVTASKSEPAKQALNSGEDPQTPSMPGQATGNLVQRFSDGLNQFKGPVLLILSGNDLTAAEFSDAANGHRKLGKQLARTNLCLQSIPEADHTFSTKEWRENVEQLTIDWCRSFARQLFVTSPS